ncbi:MAG: ubiquinol-cytochrome C chaperone [Alphaproteobacteria bacterium]|nr:ubiquinol-cytochrome C chaperone [Alphaproteobacteria bacterium]
MAGAAWWRRNPARAAAEGLYGQILTQARAPAFFAALSVPDTWNGRFDCLALHVFLVLDRLQSAGPVAQATGQALLDLMFDDMDRSVREAGVGDLGVGKQVKAMAAGFNGRRGAYLAAIAADDTALATALQRNLYGDPSPPGPQAFAVAGYARRARALLAAEPVAALLAGNCRFPAPLADAEA